MSKYTMAQLEGIADRIFGKLKATSCLAVFFGPVGEVRSRACWPAVGWKPEREELIGIYDYDLLQGWVERGEMRRLGRKGTGLLRDWILADLVAACGVRTEADPLPMAA